MTDEEHQIVKEAMDVHAENISLVFLDWVFDNEYFRSNDGYFQKKHGGLVRTKLSLFQQFIKEITQRK